MRDKWLSQSRKKAETRLMKKSCKPQQHSWKQAFLFHMVIIWINVLELCLSSWPLHANCSTKFFLTCHAYRVHCIFPFTDLDLGWGVTGQHKAKPIGFIFSHPFHLTRMKFNVVMKQFKLNILRLLLSKIY